MPATESLGHRLVVLFEYRPNCQPVSLTYPAAFTNSKTRLHSSGWDWVRSDPKTIKYYNLT